MANERQTIAALDAALECGPGQRRVKIADIAMGEPPNTRGRGVAPVSTPPASPSNPSRALEGGSAASPPKPAALMKHPTMNLARDSLATAPEQWHGLIRLIICVNIEVTERFPSLLRPSGVQTYVVPAGNGADVYAFTLWQDDGLGGPMVAVHGSILHELPRTP